VLVQRGESYHHQEEDEDGSHMGSMMEVVHCVSDRCNEAFIPLGPCFI
jgi:hypothetical protein